MSALLEQLLSHRARRERHMRPYRLAKKPAQPRAAEMAYVADLRRMVKKWGDATKEHILPNLDRLAKARTDDVGPFNYNEFVFFNDSIGRLAQNEVTLPIFQVQADRVAKFTTRAVAESMGIGYGATLGDRILGPTIADFIGENTSLIKSLSQGYVERVGSTLSEMQGARVGDIANALQDILGITESHADLIAVDQTLKLNSNVTEIRQTQVGVTEYSWLTAHDERVRPDHVVLDGTRHAWADEPPIVDRKSGRREHPGRDFRCRCQALAVVPGFN